MNVTHYESGRFFVSSESVTGRKYLVDIAGCKGWWNCSCDNFRVRILPRIEAGIRPRDGDLCKHCERVVDFLGQQVVNEMRKNAKKEKI